jgi:hypothetical protein
MTPVGKQTEELNSTLLKKAKEDSKLLEANPKP